MEEIVGYVERITYQNGENGYTVAQLKQPAKGDLTCVVGKMPSIQPGETVRCFGQWKRHLVHGMQFEAKEYRVEAPADVQAIKKYLGSGLIKGIGPVYAGKIVQKFGKETLMMIDTDPDQLLEVAGIGEKRIVQIKACWEEQKAIREVMLFLQNHGISPSFSQKIFKSYGNKSLEILQENPYRMARDIFGIGFKSADQAAAKLGIAKEAPQRIDAGIEYVLNKLSEEGHVCYPLDQFFLGAEEILEVPRSLVQTRIGALRAEDRIHTEDLVHEGALKPFIWFKPLYLAEKGIAKEVQRILYSRSLIRQVDVQKALAWVQKTLNVELAQNQKAAVAASLTEKMEIITGGPGTGKSTITNAILKITEKLTGNIRLAAPTGRAAKRMQEITGKKAVTIHSLLEFDYRAGFKRNRENPLDCDLLIVDEASMIDTYLMYSLLKAIPGTARVLFVGDINQLPSVGAGNVLKDLIASRVLPVTMLNEIFRQARGSRIVTNAHKINEGQFPLLDNRPDGDFFFIQADEPEHLLQQIVALVSQRLPKKYGFDPLRDIQVLAPMRRGVIGTENLNIVLQETLNPGKDPLIRFGKKLAPGDKVMQIRNNYQKEVYNGDVGYITKIHPIDQTVMVDFEGKEVEYDFSDLDEIVLAYAVSIHKYQGSECPCIIIPVHTTHFKLLHRNLLYTGVTRGKKLVVLSGTKKAVAICVHNDEVKKRHTGLLSALSEASLKGAI